MTVRSRCLITLTVACIAAIFAATATVALDKMSVNRLVNFFEIIAFGSEFDGIGKVNFVRKWNSKSIINYKIGGNRKSIETFRAVIQKHAKALSFDTGLKFREIGTKDPGEHFIFWFAEPDKMVEAGLMI